MPRARRSRRKFEQVIELFRRFGDRYGFDPLMLAAQGYQESRLDNSVRSKAGAVGIMQVLPLTAKDPNVDIADVEVLENNIHAAAKYMRFVMDTYFPEAKMDPFNRTMFAFASYNAGPARIAGLRRQAAGRGMDPDQWFGQVEQVAAERIGRETGAVRRQHPQVLRRVPPRRRAAGAQGEGAGGGARGTVVTACPSADRPLPRALAPTDEGSFSSSGLGAERFAQVRLALGRDPPGAAFFLGPLAGSGGHSASRVRPGTRRKVSLAREGFEEPLWETGRRVGPAFLSLPSRPLVDGSDEASIMYHSRRSRT